MIGGGGKKVEKKLEKTEISKSVIVVLLVLTVIISILGTWTVLDEMQNVKTVPAIPSREYGDVKLNINNIPGASHTFGEGKVSIKILEAE
jgi:hypothetical protein